MYGVLPKITVVLYNAQRLLLDFAIEKAFNMIITSNLKLKQKLNM